MNYDFSTDSAFPNNYKSLELFELFRELWLFDHLSATELAAAEERVQQIPDETPLLPVFVILSAPDSALFFGTKLAEQYERNYGLPNYVLTELPISTSDLQRITRGKVQFDSSDDRSFPTHYPDPLAYANELLCTMDMDDRFYWILFRDDLVHNAGPYMKRMILFLSSRQRILLGWRMIFKFMENQANTWTRTRVEDIFNTLESLRLLDHYTNDEIEQAREKALAQENKQTASILQCFPNLVYWIDAEMIYEPVEDYAELIEGLRSISRGKLEPKNIHITDADIYNPDFTISFMLGTNEYSIPMEYRGDYVNWDFMDSINQIMKQREESGTFLILPTNDQTAPIIFFDDEQLQKVRNWNLFELGTVVVAENGLGSF
jgi:hypothetical protein